ncbi:hypothetical protein FK529_08090 [Tsukamurella asaccharolytica]|uniref:PE-PGRS family protein n=1 Tax=Tsukamurella asaccharolytica TaxID=2592067 RepID=A0A5C5RD67_9ACTN|nr:hypothetical protein [Tsukamurella asaccharolytica]TWS20085.1 hypothetical protein FK529_08090 [Tsukamurella asaccharolytica]
MSSYVPKHAKKTVRRSAVATTAVAAAAALTVATPATANAAATTPTGNPQVDAILAAAPLLPGAVPIAVIPQVAPVVNQGVAAWNKIPVISGLFPVSNTVSPIAGVTPLAPGWVGFGLSDTFSVGAPLGLGGLSSSTYGVIGTSAAGVGSIGGNNTTLYGPLGSALGISTSLSATTANGLTTWTPSLGLNATAPLGLGGATATIVPVTVTYGPNTFLVGLPVINLGLTTPLGGGTLGLNLGQIGFQNGQFVLVTPSLNGSVTTPLGGGNLNVTPGTVKVGTGGLEAVGPDATFGATVLGQNVVNGTIDGGKATVTPTKVDIDGPNGTITAGPTGAQVKATADAGNVLVTPTKVQANGPSGGVDVTTPVGSGGGSATTGSVNVENGVGTVTGPTAEAHASTPAGTVKAEGSTGSGTVDTNKGTASVTGPSGGVETKTAAGDHGVKADTGSAEVSSDGVSVKDTPSVDAH